MKTLALAFIGISFAAAVVPSASAQQPSSADVARWKQEARAVTITRDDWGIAHVHGKTDADAVFGMIYAQAEDDFSRVENNYLDAIGWRAQADGEQAVYKDLRVRLFVNADTMKAKYATSPAWLKTLMNAWADGLNYYLYTHPSVKPLVIARFEPWMPLSFSDGSIGPDFERVNLTQLAAFYGKDAALPAPAPGPGPDDYTEPTGSNGIAIAPSNTVNHHALLLINPHTSFFFRSELQMESDAGLDAYGAVTWGQFFVYQGFNTHIGWMHTSTGADQLDEYLETVSKKGDRYFYKHGADELPMVVDTIVIAYKTPSGMAKKSFTVYRTMHGPVTHAAGDKWVTFAMMEKPVDALVQSFTRTKTHDYKTFRQTMDLHTNSSNNTIIADKDGDIAYFQANFIPKRDPKFDWTKPVDGSDPATDWHGVLSVDESPLVLNPASGWIYNSNNWPWSAAGPSSPKREDFPPYVENGREESPRGYHAIRVLSNKKNFTLNTLLTQAAFDSYLPSFAHMIPALLKAYDATPAADPLKAKLSEQVALLRHWDYRWGSASVPTSLAVFWGEDVLRRVGRDARQAGKQPEDYVADGAPAAALVQSLAAASDKLTADFGSWKTPWGEINRFQRINDNIVGTFDDAAPSIPVPFTSSRWGSLASFGARAYPNTKKWYGTSGNSFVAVIEFGDSVRARAVTAGGESGDPKSKHFDDEATRYASGNLREVYYYPSQLKGHTERTYHPGE